MNRFNENERITEIYRCCIAAAQKHFCHIPVADVLEPPHHWFDAALARQVAIHIACTKFHIPRRRFAEHFERRRGTIGAGIRTIDNRLDTSEFQAVYSSIASDAQTHFDIKLQEAA